MTSTRRGRPPHPDVLTPAEWRVAEGVREGRTYAEIADELGVSVNTVRYHVSNIFTKLGFTSRRELEAWQGRPRRRREWALAFAALGWRGAAAGVVGVAFVGVVVLTFAVLMDYRDGREQPAAAPDEHPAVDGRSEVPGVLLVDILAERGHMLRFAEPVGPSSGADLVDREPLDLGRSPVTSTSPDGRYLAVTTRDPGPSWPSWEGLTIFDLAAWEVAHTIGTPPDLLLGNATWSADGSRLFAWRAHCPGGSNRCHPERWERELWEIDVTTGTADRVAAFDLAVMAGHVVPPSSASPGRAVALAMRTDICCFIDPQDDPFVAVLDLATGAVTAEIPLPGLLAGQLPHWLGDENRAAAHYPGTALAPDGSRLYVVDSVEDRVTVVDLDGLRIERTVDFEAPRSPLARLGGWLWSRFASTAEAKGGPAYSREAELTTDGRYLLITGSAPREGPDEVEGYDWTEHRHGLVIIDTSTLSVVSMHPTILGWRFAVSPNGRWLVGSNSSWDPDAAGVDGTGGWIGNGLQLIDLRSQEVALHLWPELEVWITALSADSRYAILTTAGPGLEEARLTGERCEADCRHLHVLDLHRSEIVAERVLDHEWRISLAPAP